METQKYPTPTKVKYEMSGIQQKITRPAKKQENMAHSEEKINQ